MWTSNYSYVRLKHVRQDIGGATEGIFIKNSVYVLGYIPGVVVQTCNPSNRKEEGALW
jgi:hypothetical protein